MSTFRKRCWRRLAKWVAAIVLLTVVLIVVKRNWTTCQPDLTEMQFLKRQERYMDACAAVNAGQIHEIFLHEPSGLAVCHTPKVGCTFWKRIMTFLKTEKKTWKSPWEIDRYSVHHAPTVKVTYPLNSKYVKERIWNTSRVVFGRDPFSRLWSAYVDKILLPDSWKDFGLDIYRYRKLGNVTCPLNITFEDFLYYALYKKSDSHWAPLNTVCNPCDFYPKYIGKMETFSRDVTYILNKSGLGHLLTNQNHDSHVEDEMSMLIGYFFKIHASREINKKCLTVPALAERLWRAFQLNGYISSGAQFPQMSVNKYVAGANLLKAKDVITKIFVDYYRENRRSGKEWKHQRHSVLVNAYKEITHQLREDISKIYKHDFELFDYNQYPIYIFPERYS